MVQRAVFTVAIVCVPCGPRRSLIYACEWGFWVAGVEAVGEGVPPKGHGQGVGRHLSPLQGRSLLPWNSDLPSSHHMHRLHVGVWRCMCVPTKWSVGWASRFTTWCSPAPHVQTTSNLWLGNYAAWDCPCVQKAWQCATSVKDGASCGLQPDWSTPVHWQPTCSRRDHRLRSTLSRSSG